MKVKISKAGKNEKGVWIYGTAECGGLDITSVFGTNIQDINAIKKFEQSEMEFKKVIILNIGKNPKFSLEF